MALEGPCALIAFLDIASFHLPGELPQEQRVPFSFHTHHRAYLVQHSQLEAMPTMTTPLLTVDDAQQDARIPKLHEQIEFVKPACPIDCDLCKSWACPGQRKLNNFDSTFGAIIGIGTLGGGFTFTVICK